MNDLSESGVSRETGLQMAIKAINDIVGPDGLVPTLLVFEAYPRMHAMDPPISSIIQRAAAIKKAMDEVRNIHAKRQVDDALNTRNGSIITPLHDLPINSNVLVWREGNAGKTGKWTGPFRLLEIENEACRVDLPSGPTEFRTTVVKPYLEADETTAAESPLSSAVAPPSAAPAAISPAATDNGEISDEEAPSTSRPTRAHRLPERYRDVADISVFLQIDTDSTANSSPASNPTPFMKSRQKELNGLLEKGVFEVVSIHSIPKSTRIFNSRFVDEVKNIETTDAYEKSRLVVQAYNDREKATILTQAPTIQRMSQRLILALAASLPHLDLYLRDITQIYVQSTTFLSRQFYVRPPVEIELPNESILKVLKPLYGVPEAGAHWFQTYQNHHIRNLDMAESTYDSCLLYKNGCDGGFGVVGLQTDDTLILGDDQFAATESEQLIAAKLLSKIREKLTIDHPINFNGGLITRQSDSSLLLSQQRQCSNLRLIKLKKPLDLVGARGQVRKSVTPKDQYVAQRARGAYISSVCQPEAAFDLSFAAQSINPVEADAKLLNNRLDWQMKHSSRGLRFIQLDVTTMKLIVFTDASFANVNLTSQIGYVICLVDASSNANIIHWSSIKCKRVTRSVLASELYGMTHGFDAGAVLKATLDRILDTSIPMVVCTDSKSLYDCLVKLGSTQKKRLMIDLMCLRQSYERREIAEIRWIDGNKNPADAMTKSKACMALQDLVDSNKIDLDAEGWVERDEVSIESG